MKVCFISTCAVDPKMIKRIEILKQCGDVSLLYARRKMYNADENICGCNYYSMDIDLPNSNHLLKRVFVSLKFQHYAKNVLADVEPDFIYAETLDALIIATKYKRKSNKNIKIFYEVSDVRTIYFKEQKNLLNKIMHYLIKKIENKCFLYVNKLVVTSEKFYDVCYKDVIKKEDLIYLPNMHDKALFTNYKKKISGKFTVGFVGGLRYIDQMKMLVDAADGIEINVVFAGSDMDERCDELRKYCENKSFVTFIGRYNYDKEIVSIYEMLDCVYDIIDLNIPNCRILLTNKLYESALCSLPIIVPVGSYLAETATKWGIGVPVIYNDVECLKKALLKLKNDKQYYNMLCNNCLNIAEQMDIEKYNSLFVNAIVE